MGWRWLVNGLSGLVGMLLNTFAERPPQPIAREDFDKFCKLIRQLNDLRDQLAEQTTTT